MPKIVDHDATREELARRAAGLFCEHGYDRLDVHAIAEAPGRWHTSAPRTPAAWPRLAGRALDKADARGA